MITELPSCIGFLRYLHTLIADSNQLEQLPTSICSCINLRILSLADNCIKWLPEDMGRLTSLQVINLCNNNLSFLPISLTKIDLKSIWLSDNQNKPLIQFHSELIQKPYPQKVLTCVLLPQIKEEPLATTNNLEHPAIGTRRKSSFLIANIDKPLINFNLSCEEDQTPDEETAKLLRQPTPYPKDLKVHARHARALVLKHLDLGNINHSINLENAEKTDEMSSKTY